MTLRAIEKAFTMAEILLSLTIIGVVATIILPSLTGNINERTWNTQRKALYARFSQAIALMPALNGYGTLIEELDENGSKVVTEDTAAETFVTEGLSKVLKINNICDSEHLKDCGIPAKLTNYSGSVMDMPANLLELNSMFNSTFTNTGGDVYIYSQIITNAAAFETANGERIVVFYNPYCAGSLGETSMFYIASKMCANFIYDLNGTKGPNTVGKDIGYMTALYSTDSRIVAPIPIHNKVSGTKTFSEASAACTELDTESRLPNIDELAAMFYNHKLTGYVEGNYWSSTVIYKNGSTQAWVQGFPAGNRLPNTKTTKNLVRCVKR